ncbi:efflux transporter outer membrane subunit [Acerihabitans sp. KWT182]|uniref:Efflux transporter outer membrane subunit n=1 Tax=Acerihabitans sp. KWT182 TaxID=3157919 RepID=A0AAU7Q6X7_9GAMM
MKTRTPLFVSVARGCTAFSVISLSACTVGPDYHPPHTSAPAQWKDASLWHVGQPSHAALSLDWWQSFNDSSLNSLEIQGLNDNQTLAGVLTHYEQARATLATFSAQQVPEVDMGGNVERLKISRNRPLTSYGTENQSTVQNQVAVGPTISYDLDLFGRIRREVEGAKASAEQSGDDLANARLALTTEIATDYFALRELDAEIDVLNRSVALQQQALEFVTAEHDLGSVSGLDLLQQKTQLDATRIQAQLLLQPRSSYENALSTLVGTPAPGFSIAPKTVAMHAPDIPAGLPSDLLQRRPDVASAERAMAAANAQIGVAQAAYFPSITLNPAIGYESTNFASLLSAPSLMWSLGATFQQVLFDGGKRAANLKYANEGYQGAQANYRQTVLTAFQQAQDAVTGLRVLNQAAGQSHEAVEDARRLLSLSTDRYAAGLATHLDLITAQQSLLTAERQDVQIQGQQMQMSVSLVKALGGGWSVATRSQASSRPD